MLKQNALKWKNLYQKGIDAVKAYLEKGQHPFGLVTVVKDGRLKFDHDRRRSRSAASGRHKMLHFFHTFQLPGMMLFLHFIIICYI